MREHSRDNTRVLGALLLGAAAGAVLGMLFAPSRGRDLRKKIVDNAEDLIDELEEKINEGKETLSEITETLMGKAEEFKARFEEESEAYGNGEARNQKP